ncbi:hypothetical protein CSP33_04655 [Salmonella enterica subsp. enterica serovar Infantis]|nr:hypothetical protein [Salmonella enterica subsp. enterica serovar Infantis]EDJ9234063.1 hypothetical protein [Salmonella enterica subsp. enterica serovar Infantis]EDL4022108.1 hypothetical protein [Salmonella enterica subsp. enterica serovar Infantis]EDM3826166.1 hypothetical protein [Salmonella enterica subsp. enterica serovar Infantis]EDM3972571.1 hypothetical protein [Salmonella enterica subsp. enterica serovar Infantis]
MFLELVICGVDATYNEALPLNTYFRDNSHKNKAIFYGAFVGALFTRNTNKTNNKQHVNRGYDSESATFPFLCFLMNTSMSSSQ